MSPPKLPLSGRVSDRISFHLKIAPAADRDMRLALHRSQERFGDAAAIRYRELSLQALRDLAADPERPGSKERPEIMIAGARTYPLSLSAERSGVKNPRHFLLYRVRLGVVEVARLLHDASDLPRHLPKSFQRPSDL
jgi:toxin ParE1/3/4